MATRIIWTKKALDERREILEYWYYRTKSKTYSRKLNALVVENTKLISKYPDIGKATNLENIRVKVISNYLLFYEVSGLQIIILTLWDSRRNPGKLKVK